MKSLNWLRACAAIAAVCPTMMLAPAARAQMTTVSASALGGSSGLVASATIYWQAVVPARIGSSSGQLLGVPYQATVAAGAFSLSLPDALASSPNTCYAVTVVDNSTGHVLLGAGLATDGVHVNQGGAYGCVQATGGAWSFDSYMPPVTAPAIYEPVAGPPGPTGATGPPGGSLSYPGVTSDGLNGLTATGKIASAWVNGVPDKFNIVVEGDSIPAGAGLQTGQMWPNRMLADNPFLAGRTTLYNFAVSGSTFDGSTGASIASRYISDVQPLCQAATATNPTYLFLDAGTNDIGASSQSAVTAYGLWLSYVTSAKTDGCTVIAFTIRPRGQFQALTAAQEAQRQLYNSMVRSAPNGTYAWLADMDYFLSNPSYSAITTASTTSGSPTITVASAAGVTVGAWAGAQGGSNFPSGTTVVSISGTSITLSQNATATGTGVFMSFSTWYQDGLHPTAAGADRTGMYVGAQFMAGGGPMSQVTGAPTAVVPAYTNAVNLATATDLNTVTACGVYDINGVTNGPPGSSSTGGASKSWWHIDVLCSSAVAPVGYAAQFATSYISDDGTSVWYRFQSAGTWTAWSLIGPQASLALAASTDLNTVTDCGIYDGQSLTNGPMGSDWIHLQVLCNDSALSGFAAQIATNLVDSGTGNHMFVRTESSGSWLPWSAVNLASSAFSGPEHSLGTCTTAMTIDPGNGTGQSVTLTSGDTCALTFVLPSSGWVSITLRVIAPASGAAGQISGGSWPSGTGYTASAPTLTNISGAIDLVVCKLYPSGIGALCGLGQ